MAWRQLMGRVLILAVGCMLLLGSAISAGAEEKGFTSKFKPGEVAPDFTTTDIDGKKVTLSGFKGKAVMLNFWGIRCGACIEEMPYLEEMWGRYKDKGVAFLGVDTDGVDTDVIRETLNSLNLKISYTLLLDLDFTITDTYTNFLVPLTIVIDKNGIIRYIHTGFDKGREKEYEEALKNALR
jgi:peroxiredoxin